MNHADPNPPRLVFRDERDASNELDQLLLELQLLIVRYPMAAQALFRACVVEGRAFARTPEGQRWSADLVDTDLIRRGRMVWDVMTLRVLDDDPETIIPSALLDAFVKTTAVDALEPLLSHLFEGLFDGQR